VKITQVEAIPFAIPYVKPLRFASGEVHTAEHVLVRVHTDDGVTGVAEAPPRPFTYGENPSQHHRGDPTAVRPAGGWAHVAGA
jgi:L-alanine-DL-glutamate epimerase-like enolase superfamily enzyme